MLARFRRIWVCDTEFVALPGEPPGPLCIVARELRSGETIGRWFHPGVPVGPSPFAFADDDLLVAHAVAAELRVLDVLGWARPKNVIDTFVEHRVVVNGTLLRSGLLYALESYGLKHAYGKDEKRGLQERAGTNTLLPEEVGEDGELFAYCTADVDATVALFEAMMERGDIDVDHGLVRGRSVATIADMENLGVPIDVPRFLLLKKNWMEVLRWIAMDANNRYQDIFRIVPGQVPHFRSKRFEEYVKDRKLDWPKTKTGKLKTDKRTMKEMAVTYPRLRGLVETMKTIKQLRQMKLAVGSDGMNRTGLRPFRSKTGRNQPKASEMVFAMPAWLRSLIKPKCGEAIAYIDYRAMEVGVAAALSNDPAMILAYESGDPYVWFGVAAKGLPEGATKASHRDGRERYKITTLSVGYGIGSRALGIRLEVQPAYAQELLDMHREIFRVYWAWSDNVATTTAFKKKMRTDLGWAMRVDPLPHGTEMWRVAAQDRSVRNWAVQATASEILRVAIIKAREIGLPVGCPVHDAVLMVAPIEEIDIVVAKMKTCMEEASREVLRDVLTLKTDVEVVRFPDRYRDPRGKEIWAIVCNILGVDE